jgi:hypothetical protein
MKEIKCNYHIIIDDISPMFPMCLCGKNNKEYDTRKRKRPYRQKNTR